ncbi:hypothetical protein GLOIN_2v1885751 [Rhizophagus irregularis DAOM 181602=DAOM 197198]|uniref:Uncharacterized protein n=1 Tax=Rhizophagus irregularis (strain DAOM 181602 / DAOM 197198 / MUCL 43194) TaxID=747089 RepID=A0A2P4NZK5_RHIID|nr:hypothetical protein GLOIN_2v1885751 [Rhizophagus irregularis DAOM 181602=DAOM 197198]POG58569.1 hypothetical protein GLOIN_2v1885751 [Rhizophagus irregularis DAOM 181602=DAOM 197198]GBC49490.2 hypothetical protein GLOIN_2v1885751 [Rhizophagus irregularis DAOM 181602=DAOM 197198]|eukprot:XP_025165435.1 hypothetical protein GLOIN_2v1885751 [Rhizophagus irregularis DAOM 181602=DAOM 197198]
MQSTDSLRELNAKLLAEIAKLRKENAEIPELREKLLRFAEVEAENAKLRQIIEENARRDSENAELKSRVRELKARLALLEQSSAKIDLRPEFVVPVQSAMPQIVHLQIEYSIILQKFMPAKYSVNLHDL